ncbi:MAG: IS91 family transposase, partial [Pseudomonas stutzeri]|nr:IS91 family transposase [Xanthomonadales bacterium]NIQ24471.1 IS91 family transposase [Stutzerimonas stutzeri]
RLFRGKLLDALARAHEQDQLSLPDDLSTTDAFARLRARLYRKDWRVYAKRPFAGPEQVFAYLGRYTHRVGISNHRILAVSDQAVTIATRNGGTATMTPHEFIRRFLQHILPKGFVKIRHYGLVAPSNVNTRLVDARHVLGQPPGDPPHDADSPIGWRALLQALTGIDLELCPNCGTRGMRRYPLTAFNDTPPPPGRGPPRVRP